MNIEQIKEALNGFAKLQSDFDKDMEHKKDMLEKDLQIMKLTRGIESMESVIKIKDDTIEDLIKTYRGSLRVENKKQ